METRKEMRGPNAMLVIVSVGLLLSSATVIFTSAFAVSDQSSNHSVGSAGHIDWQQLVTNLPTPSAGCFIATYPIVQWIPGGTNCVTPPSQPENVGGSGNDFYAYVSSGTIGQAQGYVSSASGLTTEADTSKGSNYYSLQDTTNSYTISAGNYSGFTGEMQFIFINNPGTSSGNVYMQYWLKNYISMPFRPSCPGQGSYLTPWIQNGVNCYANSSVSYSTPLENPSGVLNYQLKGYANLLGNDESVFCVTGVMCYATAVPYTVLYLSSSWTTSEWNFLGWGAGSGACLNGTPSGGSCPTPSGSPSMTITQYLYDSTGTNVATQCSAASASGTVEYNSLTLGGLCTPNTVSPYYMYFSMN
jgi:hypothetical protein